MSVIQINETGDNVSRVQKVLASFPGKAKVAMYNAAKRAGDKARTEAGRYAAAQYTISKRTFMANTNVKQTVDQVGGTASLSIFFAGGVLNLMSFKSGFTGSGLAAQVKTSSGTSVLKYVFPWSGSAFERVGKERLPIEKKYGPSTGHMMQNEQVTEDMSKTLKDTFDQRLDHEVYRILNGY